MAKLYKGIEVPENDDARVEAVRSYEIIETPPEQEFDDITELAAEITNSPVAYISIFDDTRSWLKSSYGLPKNRPPRPRELSMCAPTICQDDLLIVPDMTKSPRYANLPAVAKPPHARFYCAMPLINRDGFALGTICVWDPELKELTDVQTSALRRLARLTLDKLERRRDLLELKRERETAEETIQRSRAGMARAEAVAHKLLPAAAAVRLLANADVEPRHYENVSVVAIELADFAARASALGPDVLVDDLNEFFGLFERVAGKHGLETIKTAGGVYLAGSGIRREAGDHATRACLAATEISDEVGRLRAQRSADGKVAWTVRIGIHSGSAVAGVAGGDRISYDVWGEAPEIACRLQKIADDGRICVSDSTSQLAGPQFQVEAAGEVPDCGAGKIPVFKLVSAG